MDKTPNANPVDQQFVECFEKQSRSLKELLKRLHEQQKAIAEAAINCYPERYQVGPHPTGEQTREKIDPPIMEAEKILDTQEYPQLFAQLEQIIQCIKDLRDILDRQAVGNLSNLLDEFKKAYTEYLKTRERKKLLSVLDKGSECYIRMKNLSETLNDTRSLEQKINKIPLIRNGSQEKYSALEELRTLLDIYYAAVRIYFRLSKTLGRPVLFNNSVRLNPINLQALLVSRTVYITVPDNKVFTVMSEILEQAFHYEENWSDIPYAHPPFPGLPSELAELDFILNLTRSFKGVNRNLSASQLREVAEELLQNINCILQSNTKLEKALLSRTIRIKLK